MIRNQTQSPYIEPRLSLLFKLFPVILIALFLALIYNAEKAVGIIHDITECHICGSMNHVVEILGKQFIWIIPTITAAALMLAFLCLSRLISYRKRYGKSGSTTLLMFLYDLSIAIGIVFLLQWYIFVTVFWPMSGCLCPGAEPTFSIAGQIRDMINISGDMLELGQVKVEATKDMIGEFYFGIKNPNLDRRCYQVLFKCIKALSSAKCDPSQDPGNDILVGGSNPSQYVVPGGMVAKKWFQTFNNVTLGPQSVGVYYATYNASISSDTYLMEIDAFQSDGLGTKGCADAIWTNSTKPWQSKQFYLKVR